MTTAETIESLGWDFEPEHEVNPIAFRAKCGAFMTPWRADAESVLQDVKAVKQKPKKEEE